MMPDKLRAALELIANYPDDLMYTSLAPGHAMRTIAREVLQPGRAPSAPLKEAVKPEPQKFAGKIFAAKRLPNSNYRVDVEVELPPGTKFKMMMPVTVTLAEYADALKEQK